MFDDLDQHGVLAVHLSAGRGALGGDVEQSGPRESADGRAIRIGIRQSHARFRREIPTDVERHAHHIGHGDLLCESFGHTATLRRALGMCQSIRAASPHVRRLEVVDLPT